MNSSVYREVGILMAVIARHLGVGVSAIAVVIREEEREKIL
jgi:phenylpyruvate tautomerase PptA (4-oxalocrotonate tautomerase family)